MKSLNEIINQEPVFLHNWSNKESVLSDFDGNEWSWNADKDLKVDREGINVLFASYGYENYSGDAWVLFEKDGELFEVNGSHCSCYGLEGQWSPEEVILEELDHRLTKGSLGADNYAGNTFRKDLCEFLDVEYVEQSRW